MAKRWPIVLLAVAVGAGLGYWSYQAGLWPRELTAMLAAPAAPAQSLAAQSAPPPVAAPAGMRQVRAEANVAPIRSVELSMPIEGIVQEVYVQEGELVAAGQLLLKLRDNRQRVLVAQAQAQLNRANAALAFLAAGPKPAEVAQMEAALAAAEANYAELAEGLVPGAIAAAEAALGQAQADYRVATAGADPQEVIEAAAELELAQAQIDIARAAYNQVRGNPDIGMLPESLALQEATAAYNAAQARYNFLQQGASPSLAASAAAAIRVAQAELDTLRQAQPGTVAEAAALVQQAQAALEFVRTGARPEELAVAQGDVDIATALLQDALVAVAETELRAPFTGTVTALIVDNGEQVAPNVPILQLADLSTWQLETLNLTELDVAGVAPGDAVSVTFDALPDLVLPGRVVRVRPVGESRHNTEMTNMLPQRSLSIDDPLDHDIVYRVSIALEQHEPRLLWNMTALVDFGAR